MKKLALMALLSTQVFSYGNKTICGAQDDRVPSNDPAIGRLLASRTASGGCTLTMISSTCAVSAGHCKSVLKVAEFNTPDSIDGKIQHPQADDIYDIDQDSIQYTNGGPGDDWSVFNVLPNKITGKLAGDAQGTYTVDFKTPRTGETLVITGYGLDRKEPTRNLTQQTNSGPLQLLGEDSFDNRNETVLIHNVDTMGGNSGSTIISKESNKVIGIHTHGGCSSRSGLGSNKGTLISAHKELMAAIKSCLRSESI